MRRISERMTLAIICAYGRAVTARSCARRSFAAETIFMALVICRVFFTLRMRRRMSRMFAKLCSYRHCLTRTHKRLLEIVERLLQIRLDRVVERLLLLDRLRQVRIDRVHVLVQLGLEVADLLDGKVVDITISSGEDDRYLSAEVEWLE